MEYFDVVRYKGVSPQNCKNCFTDTCKHCGEDSDMICTRYFPYVPVGYDNKTMWQIRQEIKNKK